jgi:hypothetical protein
VPDRDGPWWQFGVLRSDHTAKLGFDRFRALVDELG